MIDIIQVIQIFALCTAGLYLFLCIRAYARFLAQKIHHYQFVKLLINVLFIALIAFSIQEDFNEFAVDFFCLSVVHISFVVLFYIFERRYLVINQKHTLGNTTLANMKKIRKRTWSTVIGGVLMTGVGFIELMIEAPNIIYVVMVSLSLGLSMIALINVLGTLFEIFWIKYYRKHPPIRRRFAK